MFLDFWKCKIKILKIRGWQNKRTIGNTRVFAKSTKAKSETSSQRLLSIKQGWTLNFLYLKLPAMKKVSKIVQAVKHYV